MWKDRMAVMLPESMFIILLGYSVSNVVSVPACTGPGGQQQQEANKHLTSTGYLNIFLSERKPINVSENCHDVSDNRREWHCACQYNPVSNVTTRPLNIEPCSVRGKTLILFSGQAGADDMFVIDHQNKSLEMFPSNLCNWDNDPTINTLYLIFLEKFEALWNQTITVNFRNNFIKKIENLNCLTNLDTLDLAFNKIEHVPNTTFNELTFLRNLDLSHNRIHSMDLSVTLNPDLHIINFYIQHNFLKSLDISQFMSLYAFCLFDFSYNNITGLKNKFDLVIDPSLVYGPGFMNFSHNCMMEHPDLMELFHFETINSLGMIFQMGFDLTDTCLQCDAHIEPYLELAVDLNTWFYEKMNKTLCDGPAQLKGLTGNDLIVRFDELISMFECMGGVCDCTDQPSQNSMFVDCSNRNLTELIGKLPETIFSQNIHLNLSNNFIKVFDNITNLERVASIDLSNNDLEQITEETAARLENTTLLDLSDNANLHTIPAQFKFHNACHFMLNNILLECTCVSDWITEWLKRSMCDGGAMAARCHVSGIGIINASDFNKAMLDCDPYNPLLTNITISMVTLLAITIIAAILVHEFRYELLIIYLRLRGPDKQQIHPEYRYDVFLSFDDGNPNILAWVNTVLMPNLKSKGYRIFSNHRDLQLGAIRDEATIEVMNKTRTCLVILSESYMKDEYDTWARIEWKQGWNMYKNLTHQIVLVNFDHQSSFKVAHRQIKAFVRVGGQVEFTNANRDIMDQIYGKLGWPCATKPKLERMNSNRNTHFLPSIFDSLIAKN